MGLAKDCSKVAKAMQSPLFFLLWFRSSYPQQSLPCQWLYCTAGSEFWQMFIWYRERNLTQITCLWLCIKFPAQRPPRGRAPAQMSVLQQQWGVQDQLSPLRRLWLCQQWEGSSQEWRLRNSLLQNFLCLRWPQEKQEGYLFSTGGKCPLQHEGSMLDLPFCVSQHAEHHWPSWEWGGAHHCWILGRTWHICHCWSGATGSLSPSSALQWDPPSKLVTG